MLFLVALTVYVLPQVVSAAPLVEGPSVHGVGPAHKGLGPDASVPSWVGGKAVHFFATPAASRKLAAGVRQLPGATSNKVHSDLGSICGGACSPLLYHVGSGVQHSPVVHVIFWGKKWLEAPNFAVKSQLTHMYETVSGSAWLSTLTQYFDATGRVSSKLTVGSYVDERVAAPTGVNDAKIKEEVAAAIKAESWTREFNSQFVVIPAPGSTYAASFDEGFCGYHGVDGSGSSYTFIAYPGDEPFTGCLNFDATKTAGNVVSMVASHEFAESATDPQVEPSTNAEWYSAEGYEVADLCATSDDLEERGSWVQGLWDDHKGECSLGDYPPFVYAVTEPASKTKLTQATLNGVVNPEGLATKYYFEYGSKPPYSKTTELSAGSTTTNQSVSEAVNLAGEPETTYFYRLIASNSSGTTDGQWHEFVTSFWSTEATPALHNSLLTSVSCRSSGECMAVGGGPSFEGISEDWNELLMKWELVTTPAPVGALESELLGVSCAGLAKCNAVGAYSTSSTIFAYAEHWNGEWVVETTPNPTGAVLSRLQGVSCPSTTFCVAVGWYENSSKVELPMAEEWSGGKWKLQSTASLPGTIGEHSPAQVSCTSASACTAVRTYRPTGKTEELALIERWNGSAWHIEEAPVSEIEGIRSTHVELRGVSCVAETECVAAGRTEYDTLVEHWNGKTWKVESTPNPGNTNDALNAISCLSATDCVAGGVEGGETNLMEFWNGTKWLLEAMPSSLAPVQPWEEVQGISCVEPLDARCTAVGFQYIGGVLSPAVEAKKVPQAATTEGATGVTKTEAMLNGTVNPGAVATGYYFEYGPTTAYGSKTAEVSAGSGTSGIKVSQTIKGLTAGTHYYFRLVATSVAGVRYAGQATFSTLS
jgi:hypothetical protein